MQASTGGLESATQSTAKKRFQAHDLKIEDSMSMWDRRRTFHCDLFVPAYDCFVL